MDEQELVKQFNHAVELLLEGEAKNLPPGSEVCQMELVLAQKLLSIDFSMQSNIRKTLRQSLLSKINKSVNPSSDRNTELSDDELEQVTAAGCFSPDFKK